MCGRFVITSPPEAVRAHFDYKAKPNFPPRHNIAPSQPVPIVRLHAGEREFVLVRWGLVPSWAKEFNPSRPLINARAETLLEKPSFKRAAVRRRCLFPANGFYEWQRTDAAAPNPYYFQKKDAGLFAMAGIWEHWQGVDGSEIETAAIITTQANDALKSIHHRMPVILDEGNYEVWLNTEEFSAEEACMRLKPAPDDFLVFHRVSISVNKVVNDDPGLLEPISDVPLETDPVE